MQTDNPVPQASLVTGTRYGQPPDCVGCGGSIDPGQDYWICWTGAADHRHVQAAAHSYSWVGPGDDDYDDTCWAALRQHWLTTLEQVGATLLRLGQDAGGPRFFAGTVAVHAGTALEVLDADGGWLAGRFEYVTATSRWTAHLWVPIGGWGDPEAALVLVDDTIVRLPQDRRT